MPKRKKPPEKPKDQFKRFLETAKERDVDVKEAERAFSSVARRQAGKDRKKSSQSS